MLILALPVLAEETLTLAVGYTDWWLTGHYLPGDDAAKAAMGLMSYVMWLIPSMFSAIAIGATALIARSVGAGDQAEARRISHQAILSGMLFAGFVTLLCYAACEPFVYLMQLKGKAAEYAIGYARIVILAIPLIMFEQVGAAILRGAGDTVTGFVAKSIVVIFNVLISASLVIGFGPMPQLGWSGIAIGTAVGHSIGGLIILTSLIAGRAGMHLRWKGLSPDYSLVRRLFRIGLPGGVDIGAILLCQFIFVRIINSLGDEAAAAHGLGIQIEALAYMPGSAFQVAAATLAGQLLGAGQPARATRSVLLCLWVAGTIMCTAGLIFYFGGHYLTSFFTGSTDSPTGQVTAELLRIAAVSQPSLAIVLVLNGALRGAGDTVWPLICSLIGFVLIRIPLGILFAYDGDLMTFGDWSIHGMGFGVYGAWYAMIIDLFVRSLLVFARFTHGGWKGTRV